MTIGARIRAYREKMDMTQKDLAALMGLSASAIGMYEQNRHLPDAGKLVRFAEIFAVSADELLGTSGQKILTELPGLARESVSYASSKTGSSELGDPLHRSWLLHIANVFPRLSDENRAALYRYACELEQNQK